MELKEGMYARTEDGEILKIKYIEDVYTSDDIYIAKVIYFGDSFHINSDVVIKASYNIIDLIEVGDYVNGVEIVEIDNDPFIKGQINLWTNIRNTNGFGDIKIMKIIDKDIKSIVTKEQFESMQYKVGE